MATRKQNVMTYLTEWRGDEWLIPKTLEEVPAKVADEVVAYTGLEDTPENIRNYAQTVREMLEAEELSVSDKFGCTLLSW